MTDTNNNRDAARDVFWRYWNVYGRGFEKWMLHVARLEDFYLGGGRQWTPEDRAAVEGEGRPCHEVNIVKRAINQAASLQIANRLDISYLPRGGQADEYIAKVLGKVTKSVMDKAGYRYHETDGFLDGLIQQRGFIDVRMSYEENFLGDIAVTADDPMDNLPDPDGKSYDPDDWTDHHTTRFLNARQIEGLYGKDVADEIVNNSTSYCDLTDFGSEVVNRAGFSGMPPSYCRGMGWYEDDAKHRRYRIVDQQTNEYKQTLTAVYPTGEKRIVEGAGRDQLAWLIDQGVHILKLRMRRVHWRVAAPEVCAIDKTSPYEHITKVGYFPYFRRGKTVGLVDDMVSPQEMLNKFISQYATVVNASANGGWQGEANSLANMTDEQFIAESANSSLILLRKPNTQPLEKIKPNPVPEGLDKMVDFAHSHLQMIGGQDKTMLGADQPELSGKAMQSLNFAGQQQWALALDNLSKTRRLVHKRVLRLIQQYMGNERLIRISETDDYGVERHVPLPLNVIQEDGSVLNDLTVGDYDVVVDERPAQVTNDTTEFNQLMEMRKAGIAIPDPILVRASNVQDKSEIADALQKQQGQQDTDPVSQAKAALAQAQANLANSQAVTSNIQAQYEAIQTATAIVVTPQSAALADALLKSGGFVDHDAAPIVPEPSADQAAAAPPPAQIPHNTHPLDPPNAVDGAQRGLHDGPTQPPA